VEEEVSSAIEMELASTDAAKVEDEEATEADSDVVVLTA
jgi:hypothetical protein